jgi:hypothetical protein
LAFAAEKMEVMRNQITVWTNFVRDLLDALNIRPESYRFLFPAGKDSETIKQLVIDGVFPVISSLAPALIYALLWSIARFAMNHLILQVQLDTYIHFNLNDLEYNRVNRYS